MPPPIETLIPHRTPMRFIDELIDCSATTAVATACFDAGDFAVAGGGVLESALVECMAQTVAAAEAWRAASHGTSRTTGGSGGGMLVGVTDFRFHSCAPVGQQLRIEVRELRRLGPLLQVAGDISCGGQAVASGELMLYA